MGELIIDRDDDIIGIFKFVNIYNFFLVEFFEVEFISFVKVGRDGFGVVVDYNGFFVYRLDSFRVGNGILVEFDRRIDMVDIGV